MSIEILLKWHTGGGMLLSEHIDDGAAGLGVQIEWAIGFVNIPARYRAYGSVGRLIGVEGLATPPCIISIGHKRLEVVPVFCRIILVASGCRILHHWWHWQHPRRGMWVEGSPRGGTGSWGHPEVAVIDLFFLFFFHLSPLRPGTCTRSTVSFSPIISEILPNDSGVILRPFMTQQSSSILIFGTFIMTHSFAICSFCHSFLCQTLLALTPHIQNYLHLNRDS